MAISTLRNENLKKWCIFDSAQKNRKNYPQWLPFTVQTQHLGWEVPGKALHRSFSFITTDSVLKNSSNAGEETHRPAKTLVQMGLSKWFLADDSRQQKKKNNMEDMLKGRGEWEAGPKRSCQWLFHNKNACLEPARLFLPPTATHRDPRVPWTCWWEQWGGEVKRNRKVDNTVLLLNLVNTCRGYK